MAAPVGDKSEQLLWLLLVLSGTKMWLCVSVCPVLELEKKKPFLYIIHVYGALRS